MRFFYSLSILPFLNDSTRSNQFIWKKFIVRKTVFVIKYKVRSGFLSASLVSLKLFRVERFYLTKRNVYNKYDLHAFSNFSAFETEYSNCPKFILELELRNTNFVTFLWISFLIRWSEKQGKSYHVWINKLEYE